MNQSIDLTDIVGGSRRKRYNRAGKIHTGLPREKGKTWGKEVGHFVLETKDWWEARGIPIGSPEFVAQGGPQRLEAAFALARVYGPKPTEIEGIFLSDRKGDNAPRAFKKYGSEGFPICQGNGEQCLRWVDRGTDQAHQVVLDCPTPQECEFAHNEKGDCVCAAVSNFQILVPRVDLWNVYQIDTRSENADLNYEAWHDQVYEIAGRVRGVPVIITRPSRTSVTPRGGGTTHFPLQFHTPDNERLKSLLGKYLSVKKFFLSVDEKYGQAPALPGPTVPLPDEEKPDDLYPTTNDSGPCPTCGKASTVEDVDPKTGEVAGWAPCDECRQKEIDKADKKERKPRKRKEEATAPAATAAPATVSGPAAPAVTQGPAAPATAGGEKWGDL